MSHEQPQVFKNLTPEEENKEEEKGKILKKLPKGFSLEKLIKKEKIAPRTWAMDSIGASTIYPPRKDREAMEKAQTRAKIEAEGATPELQEFIENTLMPAWVEGIKDKKKGYFINGRIIKILPHLEQQLQDFIKEQPEIRTPTQEDITYLAKRLKELSLEHNLIAEEYKHLGTILTPLLNIYYSSLPKEKQAEPLNLSELFNTTSQDCLCFSLKNSNVKIDKTINYLGHSAQNSTFNVNKTEDWLGDSAENCTFNVNKAGNYLGHSAQNSIFNVHEAGKALGDSAENCTFNVGKAESGLGRSAQNSTFNVGKAESDLGIVAQDSTFNVHEAGKALGCSAKNSTFNVGKAESGLGIVAQDSTILVKYYESLGKNAPEHLIYQYNEKTQTYVNLESKEAREINNIQELEKFKQRESGLVIINDLSIFPNPEEITNNLKAGFIILRQKPNKPIGKNMTGGIVIIEELDKIEQLKNITNKNKQKQEIDNYINSLKPLVHPEKQGGFIMARVPDIDKPGETTTEVVE